jgi:hypothetical protein
MKRGAGGVWTYTTPLPSGVFTYSFYVDCADATQTGCTARSDPANPPWNEHNGKATGTVEATSQVYVPADPAFDTVNYAWQGPSRTHGTLTHVTYPSPTSLTPPGENYLSVYTPPGYDPHRAQPYPTLYLFSGDGTEMDWSTQGDAGNILDHLISTGQIQPMVVVMPNTAGYPDSTNYASFDANLINTLVPYVESHYRVSTDTARRAAAGLGYGASLTNSLLFEHTDRVRLVRRDEPRPARQLHPPDRAHRPTGRRATAGGHLRRRRLAGPQPLLPRERDRPAEQGGRPRDPRIRQRRPQLVRVAPRPQGLPDPHGLLPAGRGLSRR